MVAGMMRSGTTLLQDLCARHPDIRMTREFGMFEHLGEPLPRYVRRLRKRARRHYSYLDFEKKGSRRTLVAASFLARYIGLLPLGGWTVTTKSVQRSARLTFPGVPVVGDKVPRYIRRLDTHARDPRLTRVVIYRDCRDVVQSALARLSKEWWRQSWARGMDVGSLSRLWVAAIETMERNASSCHIIRYEDLVTTPAPVIAGLASYLGVDAAGFPIEMIRESSVGKFRTSLTEEQLAEIMAVAGPTLARLGYPEAP
jgi:hypothetical protein